MALSLRFVALSRNTRLSNNICCISSRHYKKDDRPPPDPEMYKPPEKKHPEQEVFPGEYNLERPKGKVYDKKPFKILLESSKQYSWCTCGHSKNQPLCDGSHKALDGTAFVKTRPKFRPLRFNVPDSKEYWLCNCKQTAKAPFCDGTHKRQDIQDAIRS